MAGQAEPAGALSPAPSRSSMRVGVPLGLVAGMVVLVRPVIARMGMLVRLSRPGMGVLVQVIVQVIVGVGVRVLVGVALAVVAMLMSVGVAVLMDMKVAVLVLAFHRLALRSWWVSAAAP